MSRHTFDASYKDLATGKDFVKYKWQEKFLEDSRTARFSWLCASRQSGKSEICTALLHDFLMFNDARQHVRCYVVTQTFGSSIKTYYARLLKQLEDLPEDIINFDLSKSKERAEIILKRPWISEKSTATIVFASASSEAVSTRYKGETLDFLLLDEAALYHDVYSEVFSPMLDVYKGKAIVTSTMKGTNHFYDYGLSWMSSYIDGNKDYYALDLNCYEAGVMTEAEISSKRDDYISRGKIHEFNQEYMNDPFASALGAQPFGELFSGDYKDHYFVDTPQHLPQRASIVFSVDIGAYGNMATFGVIKDFANGTYTFIHYEDKYNGIEDLILRLSKRYGAYKNITIVFPFDVAHPSLFKGKTQKANIDKLLEDRRLHNIDIKVLKKVANKSAFWKETIQAMPNFRFAKLDNVLKGVELLKRFKFKTDKETGVPTLGEVVKNGSQHAADSIGYMCHSLDKLDLATRDDNKDPFMASLEDKEILNYRQDTNTRDKTFYRRTA